MENNTCLSIEELENLAAEEPKTGPLTEFSKSVMKCSVGFFFPSIGLSFLISKKNETVFVQCFFLC